MHYLHGQESGFESALHSLLLLSLHPTMVSFIIYVYGRYKYRLSIHNYSIFRKELHNTCPLCQQIMAPDDDSWVLTEHPDVNEVNDKICSELMGLADSDDTD